MIQTKEEVILQQQEKIQSLMVELKMEKDDRDFLKHQLAEERMKNETFKEKLEVLETCIKRIREILDK